jgi:hypothetical protein
MPAYNAFLRSTFQTFSTAGFTFLARRMALRTSLRRLPLLTHGPGPQRGRAYARVV